MNTQTDGYYREPDGPPASDDGAGATNGGSDE